MKRALRWLKRIVLGGLALVVVTVTLVLVLLHTDWGRERVRRRVEAALAAEFPGGAHVGKLEGSVFGELVLRDVTLAALDGKSMIEVGTLRLDVALRPLLGKTIRVNHAIAEDVVVTDPQRPFSKPAATTEPQTPSEPSAWTVDAPDLQLHRVRVALTGEQPITVEQLELEAAARMLPGGEIGAAITRLSGRWKERGLDFEVAGTAALGDVPIVRGLKVRLGALTVSSPELVLDPGAPRGTLVVDAPAATLAAIDPRLAKAVPADLHLRLELTTAGEDSVVAFRGNVGANHANGIARGLLKAQRGDVVLAVTGDDLAQVSSGQVKGAGTLVATLHAERTAVRGIVQIAAAVTGEPATQTTLAIDATLSASASCQLPLDHAAAAMLVAGQGELRAGVSAQLQQDHCALTIADAQLALAVRDPLAASGGRSPVSGQLALTAQVGGMLRPELALEATGTLDGKRLRKELLTVGAAHATFRGKLARGVVSGIADARASGVANAGQAIGAASLHAETRDGKRVAARVVAVPANPAVKRIAASALVTLPTERAPMTLAIGRHSVELADGATWAGQGGTLVLGDRITLRGFRTANGEGRLAIDAAYGDQLDATVEATTLPAMLVDPAFRGTASGTIALHHRGARWDGTAKLAVRGFATEPAAAPLDGDVDVTIANRHVTLQASARADKLGTVAVELDVEGPRDLLDPVAWQQLDRKSIRIAALEAKQVDLAALDIPTGGHVDGKLYLVAGAADQSEIRVANIQTPLGPITGALAFSQLAQHELGAAGNASIEGVGAADITARFQFPDKPFDPLAWKRLGRGVARELVIDLDDLKIDPIRLAKLGIVAPYSAEAAVRIGVHPAASQASIEVDVKQLSGGKLVKALDLELRATSDARGTSATLALIDPAVQASGGLAGATSVTALRNLVVLEGATPITLDRWIASPIRTLIGSPLTGHLTVNRIEATRLLSYFGRIDRIKGSVQGRYDIAGTLLVPTLNGSLVATDVEGPPGIEGGRPPRLKKLELEVHWGGVAGSIDLTGIEDNGTLSIHATGQPRDLSTLFVAAKFQKFDLAPLAALMPGALAASTGLLEGNLWLKQFDPVKLTGFGGWVQLSRARIPLTPILGTVHRARARLDYDDQGLRVVVDGPYDPVTRRSDAMLGQSGKIHLSASAPRDLSTLTGTLDVLGVQLIGEVEPILNATAKAKLVRSGRKWSGRIDVVAAPGQRQPSVIIPEELAEDLLDPDAPSDLYIVEEGVKLERKPLFVLGRPPPDDPFLTLDIRLQRTKLDAVVVDDFGVKGEIYSNDLRVALGETLGVSGHVGLEWGTVDVLGRIYQIEPREIINFDDGTTDGQLNIRMFHDFPSMTLMIDMHGRISDPDPRLSSDPAIYTQGQLAGFVAGGDPGGDATTQTREAAEGTGAALLGAKISKRLKRVLPERLRIDTIRFDPATSSQGASWSVGRWITDRWYIGWKQRLEARPDENTGDLQFQYYLSREWLFELSGGDRNHDGGDILWRRRW